MSEGGRERVIKSLKFADGAQQPAVTGEPKLIVRDKLDQQIQGKTLALEGVVVVLDEPRPAGAALPPAGLRMPDVPGQSGPQARRHFTKVKLRVVYKPDIQTWPELVIEAAA